MEDYAPEVKEGGNPRVFVGNLSWEVNSQDLEDIASEIGPVSHANVLSYPDGKSKGCGIVEFQNADDATAAIATLTDREVKGRKIFLRPDKEAKGFGQQSRPFAPRRNNNFGGSSDSSVRATTSPDCQVFVANLPFSTSWQDLKDLCSAHGRVVRADVLTERNSGRSKGAGIVVFATAEDAQTCISALDNTTFNGRTIAVRLDQFAQKKRGAPGCKLFVGNLPFQTTWQDLKDLFADQGDVVRADVATGPSRRSKGFGTVVFSNAEHAQNAITALNGYELGGRTIEVRLDQF